MLKTSGKTNPPHTKISTSLCSCLLSSTLSCKFWPPWSPQTFSSVFSTQENLPCSAWGLPPLLRSEAVSWGNRGACLVCFPISQELSVLCCLKWFHNYRFMYFVWFLVGFLFVCLY